MSQQKVKTTEPKEKNRKSVSTKIARECVRPFQQLSQLVSSRTQSSKIPAAITQPQTMLIEDELRLLYHLGKDHFKNEGYIIDSGCFLGGSTVALGEGVKRNRAFRQNPRSSVIHSYDLFVVEPWTIGKFFDEDTPLDTSFEPIYRRNIDHLSELVSVHPGDVLQYSFDEPVEVLFVDLAKTWTVNDHVIRTFFPQLIPGHSQVVQQDYLFGSYNGWLHVTMEYFYEYFEIVDVLPFNSVVFLYKKRIPASLIPDDFFSTLDYSEILDLQARAMNRFTSATHREIMEQSRQNLIEMLQQRNWPGSEKACQVVG